MKIEVEFSAEDQSRLKEALGEAADVCVFLLSLLEQGQGKVSPRRPDKPSSALSGICGCSASSAW